MASNPWTKSEDAALLEFREAGKTYNAIGIALKRNATSCHARAELLRERQQPKKVYSRRCLHPECCQPFTTTDIGKWFCKESHKIRDDAGIFGSGASTSYLARARRPE